MARALIWLYQSFTRLAICMACVAVTDLVIKPEKGVGYMVAGAVTLAIFQTVERVMGWNK